MTTDTEDPTTDGPDDTGPDTSTPGRTFTQAEVDQLLARTRNQGTRAGQKAVADELGMSVAEAKALLEATRAAQDAQLTEAERIKAEAQRARDEANQIVADARAKALRADATVALLGGETPLNRDRLDLALRVVLPDVIGNDDDDALSTAIATLQASSPEWFVPSTPTDEATRRGTPSPPPPGRKVNEGRPAPTTPQDRARAEWEARKARSRPPMPTT